MYISACTEMDWNQMNEVTQPKITITLSASSEPDDFIKDPKIHMHVYNFTQMKSLSEVLLLLIETL